MSKKEDTKFYMISLYKYNKILTLSILGFYISSTIFILISRSRMFTTWNILI